MPSWKVLLGVVGIGTLGGVCMVGVAYAMTPVPNVNKDAKVQGTTVYWRNGKEMTRIGYARTIVQLNAVSKPMQDAVLAAEDRKFYNEAAISPTGIARAVANDLSGGDTQGGSTITQQYVKNAYLNQERTFTRKFKEIFISMKVGKQEDKNTILQNYLNTIFFGKGAYGVEAAAQAYYGVHAKDITVPQAAVLAANIKQPGYYDPRSKGQEHTDAVERYDYVLQGMVKMGKLSDADYAKYKDKPPLTKKNADGNVNGGQMGFLRERIVLALQNMGLTDQQIHTGGLKVYTTWDKKLQSEAAHAVETNLKHAHMPKDTRVGVVTINPNNGEVLAAYGGRNYLDRQIDDAFYSTAQIGSSMKPFVLATALKQNIGLKSKFNADSPQCFTTDGDSVPKGTGDCFTVTNDEGNLPGPVDLITATGKSLNTVFVPLGFKTGSQKVMDLAATSGLPEDKMKSQVGQAGFFLGQTDMRPLDLASGYSTIANDGVYHTPHTIIKVVDPSGKVTKPKLEKRTAFSTDVAHDTQYAMQAVVKPGGTAALNAPIPGRNIAGKTGTTNNNAAAWFSGFTPKQLETTVGMWRYVDSTKKTRKNHTAGYHNLQHVGIYSRINGGDLPAKIWHDYMTKALNGKQVTTFDPPAYVGETNRYFTPTPTPTPTPDTTPTCQPGQIPAINHCQPDPNQTGDQTQFCRRHPNFPQCQNNGGQPSNTPDPGNTCQPPLSFNCKSNTPNPGTGGNNPGTNQTQAKAARPLRN